MTHKSEHRNHDKQKLIEFAKAIRQLDMPQCTTSWGQKLSTWCQFELDRIGDELQLKCDENHL